MSIYSAAFERRMKAMILVVKEEEEGEKVPIIIPWLPPNASFESFHACIIQTLRLSAKHFSYLRNFLSLSSGLFDGLRRLFFLKGLDSPLTRMAPSVAGEEESPFPSRYGRNVVVPVGCQRSVVPRYRRHRKSRVSVAVGGH